MKSILVPVERHDGATFALQLAALTAAKFGSLVEGFALRTPPPAAIAWDPASVAIMNGSDWEDQGAIAEARSLFESIMGERGMARLGLAESAELQHPHWHWNAEPLAGDEFLGSYARAFDLTVVGQPQPEGSSITTLEAALFDSGGPVLIAQERLFSGFGETIGIIWNGSSETARTIAFAMPFLRGARRVAVLADDGALGHRPTGELVRRRLERNGIAAELKLLADGRIRSGEAILELAAGLGCDLLVKGAYTQSRIRQMIFGGATRHVLWNASVPVLMAH